MSEVLYVDRENFQARVLEADQPVLVDFWAEWCGPCRMMAPVLNDTAAAYAGKLRVAKLNVDENQQLAIDYGVMSIPTLVLFHGGKEVKRLVGYLPKEALARELDAALRGLH